MNFYLVPLVSYQTQQKMKSQVSQHRASKSRRSSTATAGLSRVSTESGESGMTACTSAASTHSGSEKLRRGSKAWNMVTLEVSKRLNTVNYDRNSDINDFLEMKKEQHRHSRHKSRSSGSATNSIASVRGPLSCLLVIEEPEPFIHPQSETVDEIAAPVLMQFKEVQYDKQTTTKDLPDQESLPCDSVSEAELSRCYSDESSIFSIGEAEKERRRIAKPSKTSSKSDKDTKAKKGKPQVEIISNVKDPAPKGLARFIKKLT